MLDKIFTFLMYLLWAVALTLLITTTFTDFKYEDLNMLTIVFLAFALLNSFMVSTKK